MDTKWAFAYGLVIGLFSAGLLLLIARQPVGKPISLLPLPSPAPLLVHVVGAVNQAGVYSLPINSRVQDAIEAAGGLSAEAAPEALNLAAPLQDGMQLIVPTRNEVSSSEHEFGGASLSIYPLNPQFAEPLININTASLEELEDLPGIGPTLAQRIIEYRNSHGYFTSVEDILSVPGIGQSVFEQIRDLISIEG